MSYLKLHVITQYEKHSYSIFITHSHMDLRMYKIIHFNRNNKDMFRIFLSHLITDCSNFDLIYTQLNESAHTYIPKMYNLESLSNNEYSYSFTEYIRLYALNEDINTLVNVFQQIRTEIIALLLKTNIDLQNLESLLLLILMMNSDDIEKYLPGICNFCFSFLNTTCSDQSVIYILAYVFSINLHIDKTSEEIIVNYFIKKDQTSYSHIWYILATRFDTFKEHFIYKLFMNDFSIREEWYKILNDHVEDLFSVELVTKLVEKNKFEFKDNVFEKLKQNYMENDSIEDLIIKVQTQFADIIKDPITELLPFSLKYMEHIIATSSTNVMIKYIQRCDLKKHGFAIVKIYLTTTKKYIREIIEQHIDITMLINEYDNRIFEWLFVSIEQLAHEYEEIYNLVNDSKSSDRLTFNEITKNKIHIENELSKFVKATYYYLKAQYIVNIDDLVYSILSILHMIDNFHLAYEMFSVIKLLFNKEHEVKRNLLQHVFDEIIYYDVDNVQIRVIKYEIFNILLLRWFVYEKDNQIFLSVRQSDLDLEYLQSIHETSSNLLASLKNDDLHSSHDKVVDVISNDKNNIFVLCSRIWEEIKESPDDGEVCSIIDLMTTIITLTGRFYQRRLLESILLKDITGYCTSNQHKEVISKYSKLLEKIIINFSLSENSPSVILEGINCTTSDTNDYLLRLLNERQPLYVSSMNMLSKETDENENK